MGDGQSHQSDLIDTLGRSLDGPKLGRSLASTADGTERRVAHDDVGDACPVAVCYPSPLAVLALNQPCPGSGAYLRVSVHRVAGAHAVRLSAGDTAQHVKERPPLHGLGAHPDSYAGGHLRSFDRLSKSSLVKPLHSACGGIDHGSDHHATS